MGYNLLKSLDIKDVNFRHTIDFTKRGCILRVAKDNKHRCYTVDLEYKYLPDATIDPNRPNIYKDVKCANIIYSLNNGQKYNINKVKEDDGVHDGFDIFNNSLTSFSNVIKMGSTFYIFPIDDFSLKLSQELYSIPANMTEEEFYSRRKYRGVGVCDFGLYTNKFDSLSVVEIGLKLINNIDVVYKDEYEEKYKIILTDKGKGLITKYKMANDL